MKSRSNMFLVTLFIALLQTVPAFAETIHCTECGMMVDVNSKFSARMVQGDKSLYFCDIGDLLAYIKRKGSGNGKIEVRDNESGAWIDATKAAFVRNEKQFKTPMGWGIAAYENAQHAAAHGTPSDLETMTKTLK